MNREYVLRTTYMEHLATKRSVSERFIMWETRSEIEKKIMLQKDEKTLYLSEGEPYSSACIRCNE